MVRKWWQKGGQQHLFVRIGTFTKLSEISRGQRASSATGGAEAAGAEATGAEVLVGDVGETSSGSEEAGAGIGEEVAAADTSTSSRVPRSAVESRCGEAVSLPGVPPSAVEGCGVARGGNSGGGSGVGSTTAPACCTQRRLGRNISQVELLPAACGG